MKSKLISVHLEIVLISAQDRCMVCTECTMGMEIILGTPDGTPSLTLVNRKLISIRLEIVLISSQDRCMVCTECTTCVEIALGTPESYLGNVCRVEACFGLFSDSISFGIR